MGFNEITEKINRGEGTIGKLIHDEETARSMNETLVALEEIAEKIGTISYEVLCMVGKRVPRVYLRRGKTVAGELYVRSEMEQCSP